MLKRSLEFKLAVVNYVLKECNSIMETSKKYGVSRTSIRDWLSLYKHNGEEGLSQKKERYYGGQFKIDVVEYMQEHSLSLSETAAIFSIPSRITVMRWKRIYYEKGIDVILKENRSVEKMANKKKLNDVKLTESEKEIKDLKARILELEMENDIIKKKYQLFQREEIDNEEKTKVVNELKDKYRFDNLLKAVNIARSSYYYHLENLERVDKYADIKCAIYYIYFKNRGWYGYRRITIELNNMGIKINRKTVGRIMQELNLASCVRMKKYVSYRGGIVGKKAPNILERDFVASRPNEKWVTDITQFSLFGHKLYLSTILDLYNGEIVSYSISMRPNFAQVLDTLNIAFAKIGDNSKLILHSDQGWQYRHDEYHRRLKEKGIIQSMSRKGNCFDNAVMENFFGHLKSELLYTCEFSNIGHFIKELEDYIYYYNNDRIKTRLRMSPVKYRELYYKSAA